MQRLPTALLSMAKRQGAAKRRQMFLARHARIEKELGKALTAGFRRVGQQLLKRLRPLALAGDLTVGKAGGMVSVKTINAMVAKESAKPIKRAVAAGAVDELAYFLPAKRAWFYIVKRMAPEQIKLPPTVQKGVDKFAAQILDQPYWTDIGKDMRQSVVDAVKRSVEDGTSNEALAKRLDEILGVDRGSTRGALIARTETTAALNYGAEAARQELADQGLIKGKRWLAVNDKDTREDHADADQQTVAVDEEFEVGGETCVCPGDFSLSAEQRCNCRCCSVSVDADE